MNCTEIRQDLITYAGGPDPAPPGVAQHIKDCAACGAEWDRAASVWKALGEHPTIEPRLDFLTRVREKISRGPWWKILVPVGVAAAALLAVFFAMTGNNEDPPVRKDPPIVKKDDPAPDISKEDREVLANLDILENMELLDAMEAVGEEFDGIFDGEDD